jgi:L-aspartate oxidase
VLATGGAGQLFAVTTNPAEATADGLAMALRAGVPVADVEFMQFHPTALHHPAMPRPLLSEALRGHGALLRDADGERFVDELAPSDVVSRAMAERMHEQGVESLWLDATELESFDERFPTIAASLHAIGLDPSRDWLPIAPAAHYLSGGVAHRPVGRHRARRPVGRRRGGLHRSARRQPAGLELVAGGHGVRCPPGRVDPGGRRTAPRRPG